MKTYPNQIASNKIIGISCVAFMLLIGYALSQGQINNFYFNL